MYSGNGQKRVSWSDSGSQSVTIHHATRDPLRGREREREREKLKPINFQTKCIIYTTDERPPGQKELNRDSF